ncbi:MAG: efflux RND transporter permease subunit, partial [Candidatus Tectomicrobia bacterium]
MAHRHRVLIPLCDQFRLAIVLLDRIRIEIEDNGLEPSRAIIEAAQRRLRPILLTTGTTVGGLIPLWLSGGLMWEPLAI